MPEHKTMQLSPVAAAIAFALKKGVAMEAITEATGLGYEDLVQPTRRVESVVVAEVFDLLREAFPNEALGLQMAKVAPFSFFGVLAHAASYAEDLGSALDVWWRYHKILASDLLMGLEKGERECLLWWHHPNDVRSYNPIPPEAVVGLTVRFLREELRIEGAVERVELVHKPAGPLSVYRDFFGTEVRFERPRNGLVFLVEDLGLPAGQGDRRRFDFLVEHLRFLEAQLAEEQEPEELREIRAVILKNARRGEYSAEALARGLGKSVRSTQRVAKAHGRSLRELLDEVREQHARRLLKDERLSVEEVAFLLGYSAESAFRRAFKRWSGQSPAELRRS